jgi:preprotein translocase subunit SecA
VLKYDDVLNRQREAIYGDRRHILEGDDLQDRVQKFLDDVLNEVIDEHTAEGHADDWDLDALWTELRTLYPVSITIDEVLSEAGSAGGSPATSWARRSSPTRSSPTRSAPTRSASRPCASWSAASCSR